MAAKLDINVRVLFSRRFPAHSDRPIVRRRNVLLSTHAGTAVRPAELAFLDKSGVRRWETDDGVAIFEHVQHPTNPSRLNSRARSTITREEYYVA